MGDATVPIDEEDCLEAGEALVVANIFYPDFAHGEVFDRWLGGGGEGKLKFGRFALFEDVVAASGAVNLGEVRWGRFDGRGGRFGGDDKAGDLTADEGAFEGVSIDMHGRRWRAGAGH